MTDNYQDVSLAKYGKEKDKYYDLFLLYSQMFFSGQPALMSEVFHALKRDNKNHVAFFFAGLCLFRFSEYWKSFSVFRSAYELDPNNYIYTRVIMLVAAYIGNDAERIFYAKHLDVLRPTEDPIIDYVENRLGDEAPFLQLINEGDHYLIEEKFEKALEKYSSAVEKRLSNVSALRRIVDLLKRLKRYREALGFARGILESESVEPEDNLLIADLLASKADFDLAQEYIKRAIGQLTDSFLIQRTLLRTIWMDPNKTYQEIESISKKSFQEISLFLNNMYPACPPLTNSVRSQSNKLRIGFVSGRFILGMGIDPILNFLPFLSKYCEVICFNVGYKTTIERDYRSYDIDIVHLSVSIVESVLLIQKYSCDIVIDLDGFHSLEDSMPEVFFYSLAPLMIRYYGTQSSTNFNLHVLSMVNKNSNDHSLYANLFSLPSVLVPCDSQDSLPIRQYPHSFCIGIAAHPWECNDYLIKKMHAILNSNKFYKIVLFYHKLGGYLSFLELSHLLQKEGLKKRVIVSPITTGVFFSYKLFLNEIDCLIDLSVTNAFDESYYALQKTIPVWSVRGHGIRTEVADLLENLKLNSYVFSSDDKMVEFLSSIKDKKLDSFKSEIKKVTAEYNTEHHAEKFFKLLSQYSK